MNFERGGGFIIVCTFIVALLLTALPLPAWAAIWRPAWVALVVVYWCVATPERVGVTTGWMAGLLLDGLTGTLIGQHALGLSVIAYTSHKLHRRLRVLPTWQQGFTVFGLVLVYQMLIIWVTGIQGRPVVLWAYWASPLASMVLWPWVFVVLRDLRRRYRVV